MLTSCRGWLYCKCCYFDSCLPHVFISYICLVSPCHRWVNTPRTREKLWLHPFSHAVSNIHEIDRFILDLFLIERLAHTMFWWEGNNRMNNGMKGDTAGFMGQKKDTTVIKHHQKCITASKAFFHHVSLENGTECKSRKLNINNLTKSWKCYMKAVIFIIKSSKGKRFLSWHIVSQ